MLDKKSVIIENSSFTGNFIQGKAQDVIADISVSNQNRLGIDKDVLNALVEVAKEIDKSQDVAASSLWGSFTKELQKEVPDRSKLKQFWEGLIAVLPSLTSLTASITRIFQYIIRPPS